MEDFISLKRSVGYKYNTEPGILKRFDSYLAEKYPGATALSKGAVTGWCSRSMHESAANHCSRASVVRQFSKYLDSIGTSAWILPKNYYPAGQQYVPHVYTPDELRRFFAETDKCRQCPEVPYGHLVMPEFFRLLFSCGLRCSEARLLTVGDVDLHQGILTVRDSKNYNSRLIPMPESMALRLRRYAAMAHEISDKVPEKVKCHMLRHSKAVHLLQAGVNLIYIRDFLGHSDIRTTEIYARADTELKRKALENAYPDLVDSNLPDWSENSGLMEWLSEL